MASVSSSLTSRGSSMLDARYDGYDRQEPYLRSVFHFLGIDDVTSVHAQGLSLAPDARPEIVAKAKADIENLIPLPQPIAA